MPPTSFRWSVASVAVATGKGARGREREGAKEPEGGTRRAPPPGARGPTPGRLAGFGLRQPRPSRASSRLRPRPIDYPMRACAPPLCPPSEALTAGSEDSTRLHWPGLGLSSGVNLQRCWALWCSVCECLAFMHICVPRACLPPAEVRKGCRSPETTIGSHQTQILYQKAVFTQPPLFQLPCQGYLCAS